MDCSVGHHITRVSRTPKLEFPSTINIIAIDLFPLLEVVWKGKEAMKKIVETLNKRKREIAELSAIIMETNASITWSTLKARITSSFKSNSTLFFRS